MRPHYIAERVNLLDLPRRMNALHEKGYRFVQALKDDQDAILIFEDCQILKQTPDRVFVFAGDGRPEYRAKLATLVKQVVERWGPDVIEFKRQDGRSEEGAG